MKKLLSRFIFLLALINSTNVLSQINVTMTVNSTVNRNTISPYVYGANEDSLRYPNPSNIPVNRMGGNRLTGYNWENNWSNAGTDWQNSSDNWIFQTQGLNSSTWQTVAGSGGYLWVDSALKNGANMLFTLQAAGYVAADGNGSVSCTAPCNRWIPVSARKPSGSFVYPPNLTDNAVYMDEYISFLTKRYGYAYQGGIKFYQIDNEPDLWNSTHPYIWGTTAVTPTQIFNKNLEYAKMIKDMDSSAKVVGLSSFGVYGWETMLDIKNFLKNFKTASDNAGKRLLDVVDVHIYPEEQSTTNIRVTSATDVSTPVQIARVQAPRSLWDSTFVENSWVPGGAYGGQACMYIKRLKSYIDQNYPGTQLSISEWSYGGNNDISGAVATADVLGIYGREGVYMSNYFGTLSGSYIATAYQLFRNYDGKKSTFGDLSLQALTNDNQNSSIYAASVSSTSDKELHLIVINKSNTQTLNATIKINSSVSYATGTYYGFDGTSQTISKKGSIASISNNSFTLSLPAFGVYHVVLMSSVCTPPTITAGSAVSICNGTSTVLTASGGASYKWSSGATTASVTVSPSSTTTYTVTGTNASSCSATSSVVVTVNTIPLAPTVTSPVFYTTSAAATALTATGSNLLWYTVATGGTSSSTAPIPITTTVGSTNYYVSQTSNSCESPRATIIVTVTQGNITQSISLTAGWNLISINVYPTDSSIATLYNGLNVQEIKTADSFWESGQISIFNSLIALTAGNGYLVYMNAAGTLQVVGKPMSTANFPSSSLKSGWNVVGCPFQTSTALSSLFNSTNSKMVKDFDGFWISGGTANSIQILNPGKGYFLKK